MTESMDHSNVPSGQESDSSASIHTSIAVRRARPRRRWTEFIAVVVSVVALGGSLWANHVTRTDTQEGRELENLRRLREILGRLPAVQASLANGDVTGIQTAQFRVHEAVQLADELGSRVLPAERAGLALALILIDDFKSASAILETAQAETTSPIDEIVILRLRAQVAFGLQDPETARTFVQRALDRASPETLGSQFLSDDVDIVTELLAFQFELVFGECAMAKRTSMVMPPAGFSMECMCGGSTTMPPANGPPIAPLSTCPQRDSLRALVVISLSVLAMRPSRCDCVGLQGSSTVLSRSGATSCRPNRQLTPTSCAFQLIDEHEWLIIQLTQPASSPRQSTLPPVLSTATRRSRLQQQ